MKAILKPKNEHQEKVIKRAMKDGKLSIYDEVFKKVVKIECEIIEPTEKKISE